MRGSIPVIAVSLLALFAWQLSGEWLLNPQYSFGLGVPILGTVLFFRRWQNRPEPAGADTNHWLILPLLLAWIPIRILREANMDWRFLEWLIGVGTVAGLFILLKSAGGTAYVRHFAVPVLFLLFAVPWPTRLEATVVQGLSLVVVRMAVEALRWMGIAAWSAGNIIQMPGAAVGVEDACSGIRSFQGAAMAAVFLGELLRLKLTRRILLVFIGAVFAVVVNFGRTLFLSLATFRHGEASAEAWHDGAGLLTLIVCFCLLWCVALILRSAVTIRNVTKRRARILFDRNALPVVFASITAIILAEIITAAWYRSPTRQQDVARIRFDMGALSDIAVRSIPDRTQSILRYNSGALYVREMADGSRWWIYSLRWDERGIGTPLARFHSPEVCLPAAGFELKDAARDFQVGAAWFRASTYDWLGKPVFVFSRFASETGTTAIQQLSEFDLTWSRRLSHAIKGVRPGAQEVLQIVITGVASSAQAEQSIRELVRDAIRS